MSPQLNISAGELFELIKPAALILSALLSTWVFASALKRFSFFVAQLWALATLLLPPIVLPLYVIVLLVRPVSASRFNLRRRIIATMTYAAVALAGTGFYLQQETQGVDAHLAQAAYAKVRGNRGRAIAEYLEALRENDDPHTHKLLGIELVAADLWTEALSEFRLAEKGGEPDDVMILRIASLLDALNLPGQARLEYQRFLEVERACKDFRIGGARLHGKALQTALGVFAEPARKPVKVSKSLRECAQTAASSREVNLPAGQL